MRLLRFAALSLLLAFGEALAAAPSVSAGGSHSLALHADGTLRAWGDDSAGALGTGRSLLSLLPIPVAGLPRIVAIACGDFHTVALAADGTVWAGGATAKASWATERPTAARRPFR